MSSKAGATAPFSFFEWMVARRYLGATRTGAGVSLISVIAFAGIMLAVATLIIVMSVMQGFRAKLLDQLLGLNGHVFVQSAEPFTDFDDVIKDIIEIPGVTHAAPLIQSPVYATTPAGEEAVMTRAMRRADLLDIGILTGPEQIVAGTFDDFGDGKNGGSKIAIGSRLAAKLGARVGGGVTLITGGGTETAFGRIPVRSKTFVVGAIFEVDNSQYDTSIVLMPFEQAQVFFQTDGATQQVEVRVDDPDKVDLYMERIEAVAPRYSLLDWRRVIGPYFDALKIERSVMRLILMLVVAIAALNIITGLVMLVKDKTGDIAVLRTMGATQGSIMRIFFLSGALIGVLGTVAGVVFGTLFVLNIDAIEGFLSALFNMDLFNADIYYFSRIPAEIQIGEIITIVTFSLFMSFISTIFPARRAARLDPVEALRYE
ncbi:MAG: lipoprotein-releasing ABC transporter permease subunit [Pseudomonadota bacterium]